MISFLHKHGIISKRQYGYQPGISTSHALFDVSKHICENLDRGDYVFLFILIGHTEEKDLICICVERIYYERQSTCACFELLKSLSESTLHFLYSHAEVIRVNSCWVVVTSDGGSRQCQLSVYSLLYLFLLISVECFYPVCSIIFFYEF